MIKVLLVDDEPLATKVLKRMLSEHQDIKIIAECYNGIEAYEILLNNQIDLIFLDINMPRISGLNFVKSLQNPPSIIFVTAYMEFAVEGFSVDAIDYLLKPVTRERLAKSLNKFRKWNSKDEVNKVEEFSYFKDGTTTHKVMYEDILFFQSLKDYVKIHLENGIIVIHSTMKNLETILPPSSFIRIHRSYIVSTKKVDTFQVDEVRIGKHILPIGESYKSGVKKELGSLR